MIRRQRWIQENIIRRDGIIVSLLKEGSTSSMQGEAEQVSYIRAVNKTIIGLSSVNPVSEADQQITILY